jgi:uncharacterized protein
MRSCSIRGASGLFESERNRTMNQKTEHRSKSSGFASMDRHKQREIARKGGMAAHQKGTAHEFTVEEARDAGRKGGQQVSSNRSHMIEIGRLGGRRSAERRRTKQAEQPKHHEANARKPEPSTQTHEPALDEAAAASSEHAAHPAHGGTHEHPSGASHSGVGR